ncbi:MAG: family 20 glycosylhydrolase [Acidobacteria bacterium]|nr:family 20 glycosylhydrolase [Acidobacteriota bacterium]
MKRFFFAAAFLGLCVPFALAHSNEVNIIPKPMTVDSGTGSFTLRKDTRILVTHQGGIISAELLNGYFQKSYGFKLKIVDRSEELMGFTAERNVIIFLPVALDASGGNADEIKREKYSLNVEADRIYIGGTGAGQFYALQTVQQLLPAEFNEEVKIPVTKIVDAPRFAYRGMHLDVARHFQPVGFVKKFIDQMAQYKFNTFHWHLTDDQGWRIEIKKYPRLTEVGSRRPETMVDRNFSPYIGDGIPHGGFYTQEQIREVVAYAKERHITVIPEIELPGHASAALAAYPQFGCKADYEYKVQTTWGIFKEVFCPTEETFKFLEDVLDETIALFPDSPYIHIGGDEVLKDHWKESAFVQELKKRENLKDENEVQSYFIRRIERHLSKRGKKMIGWDEILEGGLAPNATVMSWRGMRGGIEAAKSKHDVIMTPTTHVYFDYGQGDPAYEPLNIGSYVPLSKVYSFEPVPPELTAEEAKYVIGGQANIWTEYMKTPQHIEYMAFPRMLALSEVLWSKKEDRDFADFQRRLNAVLPRLDKQGVNYRIPEPGGLQNIVTESERVSIELQPAAGTRVHITTDGTTPNERSPVYSRPIEIRLGEGEVKTLKTIVVNAAGRKSVVYAATIVRGKMREPDVKTAAKPGLSFNFTTSDNSFEGGPSPIVGETRSTSLNQFAQSADLKKPFAVTFDGFFRVPEDGVYEFQIDSTWDATVVLGDSRIIDDAGTRDRKIRSAIVPLKAGLHKMSIRYNHRGGDSSFRFRWGIKGRGLTQAWGGEFVH